MGKQDVENSAITPGELQLFRTLWHASSDNFFIVRRETNGEYISEKCNRSLESTFHLLPNQLDEKALSEVLDAPMLTKITDHYDECILKQQPLNYEEHYVIDESGERFWNTTIVPVVDNSRGTIRIFGISREITAIRRAKNTLKALNARLADELESNRQKDDLLLQQSRFAAMGEMLNMIAHQWRQPLHALGIASISLRKAFDLGHLNKEKLYKQCEFIERQTQQMNQTVVDFMSFLRPETKQQTFSLSSRIDKVIEIIGVQLQHNGITLRVDCPPAITVHGIPNAMEHILLNLLGNARDAFTDRDLPRKEIVIQAQQFEAYTTISVSDTAGGVNEADMPQIFDPYFTTKGASQGTGIGLYMTKKMIENQFQGNIRVANDDLGAVFVITIPTQQTSRVPGVFCCTRASSSQKKSDDNEQKNKN